MGTIVKGIASLFIANTMFLDNASVKLGFFIGGFVLKLYFP